MPRWEDKIFGKVTRKDWLDVGMTPPARQNDPIDRLFGDTKTENLVAEWESIAAEYGIPMMAQFHGFDTEAQKTFRVPIDSHNIEKGLIKVKINQSERLRQLATKGVVNEDALYNYVLDDGIRLADQVVTRTKVAKNELMATGKITIKENNLDLTVDYGVPTAQTQYVLDFNEQADIASQIQAILDDAIAKGVTINGMLTSRKNISKIRRNAALQKAINGNVGAGALISNAALDAYFATEFGITTIITNDLTYGASAEIGEDERPVITTKKYYPENKVTFFATNPNGILGTGLWGNPPEVDAARFYQVGTNEVSPYVYIMQWMETDPAVLWTKASGLFMPVLYNPDSLFIATISDSFLDGVTVSPESGATTIYGHSVSDLQSSVAVSDDNKITGTLKYVDSGTLAHDWGAGYFLVLKWTDPDASATSLKVGLEPSAGTGLVEAIQDTDRNGVFKITSKNVQKFKVIVSNSAHATVQTYDLTGLTLQEA